MRVLTCAITHRRLIDGGNVVMAQASIVVHLVRFACTWCLWGVGLIREMREFGYGSRDTDSGWKVVNRDESYASDTGAFSADIKCWC